MKKPTWQTHQILKMLPKGVVRQRAEKAALVEFLNALPNQQQKPNPLPTKLQCILCKEKHVAKIEQWQTENPDIETLRNVLLKCKAMLVLVKRDRRNCPNFGLCQDDDWKRQQADKVRRLVAECEMLKK